MNIATMMKTGHISVLGFMLLSLCTLTIGTSVKDNNYGLYNKIIGVSSGDMKPGSCPPQRNYNKAEHEICHKDCHKDSDCIGKNKCCPDNCHSVCKPPAQERSGTCPSFELALTSEEKCDDFCTTDAECPGTLKCCKKSYGKSCVLTLADIGKPNMEPIASKGFCPQEVPSNCVLPERKYCDEISCVDGYKCCPKICRWVCQKTLTERAGQCPKKCPSETGNKTCSSDYDCSPLFKCCTACGNRCVRAVNVPTFLYNSTSTIYVHRDTR